jgi:hypothetical protein
VLWLIVVLADSALDTIMVKMMSMAPRGQRRLQNEHAASYRMPAQIDWADFEFVTQQIV